MMDTVIPIEAGVGKGNYNPLFSSSGGVKLGTVVKVLENRIFLVEMDNGTKVKVRSDESLSPGSLVKIISKNEVTEKPITLGEIIKNSSLDVDAVVRFSAIIPLAFGGKHGLAKLNIFVEKNEQGLFKKSKPAIYFVFTIKTENQGDSQWCVHLLGKQITLQAYFDSFGKNKGDQKILATEIETSLKNAGFNLNGPTLFLSKPLNISSDYRLNVRG